jgi:hypothetical protein
MSKIQTGVVVGKDFRPPTGQAPKEWCYLVIDVSDDERVAIRLHPSKVDRAILGDRVVFSHPRNPERRVRNLRRM